MPKNKILNVIRHSLTVKNIGTKRRVVESFETSPKNSVVTMLHYMVVTHNTWNMYLQNKIIADHGHIL